MNELDQNAALEQNTIEGRNSVIEALKGGQTIEKIFIARQTGGGKFPPHILAMAREQGVPVVEIERKKLDTMSTSFNHQGIVAIISDKEYVDLETLLAIPQAKGQAPFFIVCDHLSDTYNLGAVLRTAYAAGAHGVIMPKRRNATLTAAVYKASAGAAQHIPICKVANIADTIERLKKQNIWVYGADISGQQSIYSTDFTGASALVIGSEDSGISRLVAQKCDVVVTIPMPGDFNSLNASAAAAVLIYEVVRQRGWY